MKAELRRRGAELACRTEGGVQWLTVNGGDCWLRVKTKTSGDWQYTLNYREREAVTKSPPRYWVLVDLGQSDQPVFYIIADQTMRHNIAEAHEAYLQGHAGTRPVNPHSKHHKITEKRFADWKAKWDQPGLPGNA